MLSPLSLSLSFTGILYPHHLVAVDIRRQIFSRSIRFIFYFIISVRHRIVYLRVYGNVRNGSHHITAATTSERHQYSFNIFSLSSFPFDPLRYFLLTHFGFFSAFIKYKYIAVDVPLRLPYIATISCQVKIKIKLERKERVCDTSSITFPLEIIGRKMQWLVRYFLVLVFGFSLGFIETDNDECECAYAKYLFTQTPHRHHILQMMNANVRLRLAGWHGGNRKYGTENVSLGTKKKRTETPFKDT